MTTRIDFYTKAALTAIVLLLAVLAMRPVPVAAQTDINNLYIEPGTSPIRNLNGGIAGEGKVVINMSTGDVYGYLTRAGGSPYPIDALAVDGKPFVVKPVFLGKYDFSAIRRTRLGY